MEEVWDLPRVGNISPGIPKVRRKSNKTHYMANRKRTIQQVGSSQPLFVYFVFLHNLDLPKRIVL